MISLLSSTQAVFFLCILTQSFKCQSIAYQLLESRLVQVGLQGKVAEAFPGWLVGLHLHWIPLHGVVVSDRTPSHQRSACQALQILAEDKKQKKRSLSSVLAQLQGKRNLQYQTNPVKNVTKNSVNYCIIDHIQMAREHGKHVFLKINMNFYIKQLFGIFS